MRKLSKMQKLIILISIILMAVIIGIVVSVNVIKINITNGKYNTANNNSSSSNLLPEYIKEGITLGGVTGTLEDLDTSDATATAMDIAYGETAYVKGKKIEGLFVERDSLKVGQYVEYIPDTAEAYSLPSSVSGYENNQTITQDASLTWQILSINDDGTIDLTTSVPISQIIGFGKSLGYNNCVFVLNDICVKQYSNKNLGLTARSINLENDIEPKMNKAGINRRNTYGSGEVFAYGTVTTWTNNGRYYPMLFAREKGTGVDTGIAKVDGIEKNDAYYNAPTTETFSQATVSLTAKSDEYYMSSAETPNYFDDKNWYELIFGTETNYWIASRCVYCGSTFDFANLGLRYINGGNLDNCDFFLTNNVEESGYKYFRPIVTLNTNIKIYGGDGSDEHPYQLSA